MWILNFTCILDRENMYILYVIWLYIIHIANDMSYILILHNTCILYVTFLLHMIFQVIHALLWYIYHMSKCLGIFPRVRQGHTWCQGRPWPPSSFSGTINVLQAATSRKGAPWHTSDWSGDLKCSMHDYLHTLISDWRIEKAMNPLDILVLNKKNPKENQESFLVEVLNIHWKNLAFGSLSLEWLWWRPLERPVGSV